MNNLLQHVPDEDVKYMEFSSENGIVDLTKILPMGSECIFIEILPTRVDKRGRQLGRSVKGKLWYKEIKDGN